jgi:hypothetical protein
MATRNTSGSGSGGGPAKANRPGDTTAGIPSAPTQSPSIPATTSGISASEPRGAGEQFEERNMRLVDRVKERAAAQLTDQVSKATEGLGSVAQAVKGTTQQLRDNNQETAARIVEKTAEQIERFSNQLRQKDFAEIVRDAQQLARRQPALFIGGSFALGIVAARFFKSSPQHGRDAWPAGSRESYTRSHTDDLRATGLRGSSATSYGATGQGVTDYSTTRYGSTAAPGAASTPSRGNDPERF